MSSATERTTPTPAGGPEQSSRNSSQGIAQKTRAGVEQGKHAVDAAIADRPGAAVLLGFVLGAGVGTLVGAALFERPRWRSHHEPEGLMQRIAETVSKTVRDSLPAAMRR